MLHHYSGQIIATSHGSLTPNGGDCKGIPIISGKSRSVNYYDLQLCWITDHPEKLVIK